MSQWSSAAGGPGSGQAGGPGSGQPGEPRSGGPAGDEYPDDLWPDEEDVPGRPAGDGASGWLELPAGPGLPGARPPGSRRRFVAVVIVAAAAAAAGAGIMLAVDHAGASPAASSFPEGSGGQAPGRGGGPQTVGPGNGTVPGGGAGTLPGGGNGSHTQIMMIGKVTAVSRTSITLGGPGQSITAAVTSSTRVSGKVSSISGVKVGDQVSAQMTRSGGRTVLVSVQDPAQALSGGAP